MIALVFLVSCLMFVFSNALFYTSSLLMISVALLLWMVSSNIIRILMLLLVLIVYVGAIIILIGYICAVCPNLVLSSNYNYVSFLSLFSLLFFIMYFSSLAVESTESCKSGILLRYFFRAWGVFSFVMIVLILFFTLLIVTSQYISPQGPFRSTI